MARVLVDIDGTIADLLPAWLASYKRLGGEHIEEATIVKYNFKQYASDPALLDEALAATDYSQVRPYQASIRGLVALRDAGHELRFVSYVPDWCPDHYQGKVAWMRQHVPDFHTRELVFCHSSEKRFLDGDVLCEDYPQTLAEWLAYNPDGYGVLVMQPYNANSGIRAERLTNLEHLAIILERRVHAA